jgi:hypothetical protein
MPGHAEYKGWPDGENNLRRSTELEPTMLRRSVNYDITDTGDLLRRQGFAAVVNATVQPGSLFSNGDRCLYVASGNLFELQYHLGEWRSLLVRLNVGSRRMAYVDVNGDIYWANGLNTGIFTSETEDLAWGLHAPVEQPNLYASLNGGRLTTGTYQVAVTFVSERGEESGTGVAAEITLDETSTGSIELRDIPASTEAKWVRIYASTPNGEGLYRVTDILNGITSHRITAIDNAVDIKLQTQHGIKPPAGDVLEYFNGRIYIGQGNVVWMTEPLRYGLVKPHKSFLMFPSEVTVIKAVTDGIFICADKTYWISGTDTTAFQQREVLPYGAVKGTGIDIPDSDNVAWFSERGAIVAGLEAQVSNLQEERSAVSKFQNGAMLWREHRGLRQLVATLGSGEQSSFLAPDYVELEVARRGDAI